MKHIYIFNESSRAAVYGVGTYIRQMTESLAKNKDISFYIVNINSEKGEFEIENVNGINNYHIPYVAYGSNMSRYYRNSFFLIRPQIEQNTKRNEDELIFHFNFYQELPLIKVLKEYYPKAKIIFSIHYMNWCFTLNGNVSYLRRILAEETINLLDNKEKNVLESIKQDKEVFNISDRIICLAKFTEEVLLKDYNIPKEKIKVVYNGLKDDILLLTKDDRIKLKKKLYIDKNEKIILFVGRLTENKGLDVVIKAFKNIIKNNRKRRLVIVGDGDYSTYMKESQSIWSNIIFTGIVDKETLYRFYQMADIGVMPSINEQCSYVAIEMLAHGLPLIASTATGLGEMLTPGPENLKLNAKEEDNEMVVSVEECTNKILHILGKSDEQVEKTRKWCRQRYLERYEATIMKNAILDIYNEIFAG